MTINEEKELRQVIREIVEEFVSDFYNEADEARKKKKAQSGNNKPTKSTGDKRNVNRRREVIQKLQNKFVDNAPYAYDLWPKKSKGKKGKANARSFFYKCRDGKKNDNGDTYSFTDTEINHLYAKLATTEKK